MKFQDGSLLQSQKHLEEQQGEQHGLQKDIHDVATRLLHERVSLEIIKRATGLSLVEIKKIQQKINRSFFCFELIPHPWNSSYKKCCYLKTA